MNGPELIGDVPPSVTFFPWEDAATDVCTGCGCLVPASGQQAHVDHHRKYEPAPWPEDWREQIKAMVMQAWAGVLDRRGAEGLTWHMVDMIGRWQGPGSRRE